MGSCTSAFTSAAHAGSKPEDAWIKKVKIVFVLGGPGSGKGTQCAYIKEQFQFGHLSAGDLLREEVASGSARGKECEALMKEGKLVPVEVTLELLKKAMEKLYREKQVPGFLIDGFPRETSQADAFRRKMGRDCDFVLYYTCTDETMKARIMERSKTSGRSDDNEETIKKRLTTFHEQTVPVVTKYGRLHKLREVDANGSVKEVRKATDLLFREEALKATPIVFVLGGPGCGKGTQCVKISKACNYKHLSTGDLLRAEVAAKSELGERCAAIMANGGLVPVEDLIALLYNAVIAGIGPDCNGFLIDGFPRELPQIAVFKKKFGRDCNFALYFECSDDVMRQRILHRGATSGRADDNADAAVKRLHTFRSQSMPVVKHYENQFRLKKVNAERAVDDIFESAMKFFPEFEK